MHGLEAQYSDRMNFVYLDIDDPRNDGFKDALGYRYQPHLLLLDGEGKILEQWVGKVGEEQLATAIRESLGE